MMSMAVQPMITNSNITVYNKYVVAGVEKFQRTQITNVKWENRKASNVMRSGLLAADSVALYIPMQRGANYVKPKAWQALVTKTSKWTLQDGDYVVKGLVTDEIKEAVTTPTPIAAFTVTMLKAKYDDVVMIKSVDTLDSGSIELQHFQAGAS